MPLTSYNFINILMFLNLAVTYRLKLETEPLMKIKYFRKFPFSTYCFEAEFYSIENGWRFVARLSSTPHLIHYFESLLTSGITDQQRYVS